MGSQRASGFSYNAPSASLLDAGSFTELRDSLVELLDDHEADLSDLTVLQLTGTRGTATFTAAAGGVAVTFSDPFGNTITFNRAPVVLCQIIDGAGAHVAVKGSTTTTTGFTAQVYVGGVEQGAGSYTFNWLALV